MGLIQVASTSKMGTSTFIQDFCDKWPIYSSGILRKPEVIAKFHKIKKLNSEKAWDKIFDEHFSIVNIYDRLKDNIIFDGSILNDLVTLIYIKSLHPKDISDEFVIKYVYKVRKELSKNDIIFYIPLLPAINIDVKEENKEYRESIDNLLSMIKRSYDLHQGSYFPTEDSPAMLDIMGDRLERTHMAALYINLDGSFS